MMVGAILTQNTSWRNAERAIASMRSKIPLEPDALLGLPLADLQDAVRPSGYYRQKADRLRGLCRFLLDEFDGSIHRMRALPTSRLREMLLALRGIGPETADSILLYALNRPAFVVDAYTERLLGRLGLLDGRRAYAFIQGLFTDNLPADPVMYGEYHALIVAHAKERCRKRDPLCGGCGLEDICPFPQNSQ